MPQIEQILRMVAVSPEPAALPNPQGPSAPQANPPLSPLHRERIRSQPTTLPFRLVASWSLHPCGLASTDGRFALCTTSWGALRVREGLGKGDLVL